VNGLHCVGLDHAHIITLLEASIHSDRVCLLCDEVGHHISDFHAQDQLVWEFLLEFEHQSAIPTADVDNSRDEVRGLRFFLGFLLCLLRRQILNGILVCINV
jgi:hypothetical protein